uniref:Uncharacterized protein n=1 Tax=Arundo donax TaxID=35708 RepID=A0A0A9FQ48_ARUDO
MVLWYGTNLSKCSQFSQSKAFSELRLIGPIPECICQVFTLCVFHSPVMFIFLVTASQEQRCY